MNAEDTPVTVTDLARRCRADAQLVLRSVRHLVETGRAEPAMVDVYGVPTMYELILQSARQYLWASKANLRHTHDRHPTNAPSERKDATMHLSCKPQRDAAELLTVAKHN